MGTATKAERMKNRATRKKKALKKKHAAEKLKLTNKKKRQVKLEKARAKRIKEKETKKKKELAARARDPKYVPRRSIIRHPKTAWIFFNSEMREKIKQEQPDIGFGEIGKILSPRWKALSKEEQQPYVEKHLADIVRYKEELSNLSQNHRRLLREHRRIKKQSKKKKPKTPLSPYMFFVTSVYSKLKEQNPDCSFIEIGKKLGEMWNQFPLEERQEYIDQNRADKLRYEKELQDLAKQEALMVDDDDEEETEDEDTDEDN